MAFNKSKQNSGKYIQIVKWIYALSKGSRLRIFYLSLIGSLISLISVGIAILSKSLIDYATLGNLEKMLFVAIFYAVLILAEVFLNNLNSYLSVKYWQELAIKTRTNLYQKLTKGYWLDYNRFHSGDLNIRMGDNVVDAIDCLIETIPDSVSLFVHFTAALLTLLFFEPIIGFFAFIFGPAAFLIGRLFSKKLEAYYDKILKADSACNSYSQESFQNMTVIKTFNYEQESSRKMAELQIERKEVVLAKTRFSNRIQIVKSGGKWIGYFLAFGYGAYKLSAGEISFGVLTAFMQLFHQIQGPMSGLAGYIPQLIGCITSVKRLIEIEDMRQEEPQNEIEAPEPPGLMMKNVSFSYTGTRKVIRNTSFVIKPGEFVGLMGESGEGKTTIIRLIQALVQKNEGEIYFFTRDTTFPISPSTRRLTAYVPQGNSLVSGSILSNLRIGNADASEKEIQQAVADACADTFISELPEGIHTVLGERGIGLSEGQAQRIAIARALLRKASFLILDEATSALNIELEKKILDNIRKRAPARTCLLITHRTSTLSYCDKVLKIESGAVKEV